MEFNNPYLLHKFDEVCSGQTKYQTGDNFFNFFKDSSKPSYAQPQSNYRPLSTPCHQTTPLERLPNEYSSHNSTQPGSKPHNVEAEYNSTHTPLNDWNSLKRTLVQYQRARDALLQKRRNNRIKITPDDELILEWKEQEHLSWEGISAKLKAKGRWIYTLSYVRQRYNRACRVRRILGKDFVLPSQVPVRKSKDIMLKRRYSSTLQMPHGYPTDNFYDEVVDAGIYTAGNSPPCLNVDPSVTRQLFRINPFVPVSLNSPTFLPNKLKQESLHNDDDNREDPAVVYMTDVSSNVNHVHLIYEIPNMIGVKQEEEE